jgi:hypothetical protein
MHRPQRCRVRELNVRAHDPAPYYCTLVTAGLRKLVGPLGILQLGIVAVALEHELSDAANVDLPIWIAPDGLMRRQIVGF